jgi:acyl-CoA synthetase (AMP-forming)/AMP-acid ligase II/thioesterase domain-containing protein
LNETGVTGLDIKLLDNLKKSSESDAALADFKLAPVDPDSDAILFLTSGSTGFSKAVVHTHRTILAACRSKGAAYSLSDNSSVMNWVAFDHVAGSLEMHFTPLLFGASQVHVDAATILSDPILFLRFIDEYKISLTFAPNFLISKLARDLSSSKLSHLNGTFDLSSLRRINSGGEAVVSSTVTSFLQALNNVRGGAQRENIVVEVSAGFGMTETCAGCIYSTYAASLSAPGDAIPTHEFLPLGSANPSVEMRVTSPEDSKTVLADGQSGELQIRGPVLFTKYYNNAAATEESFVEGGWFRTGDLGIIENGELRLSGRIKDTIIVHGVSYGIPELETHLQGKESQGLIADSYLVVAPFRGANQDSESFVVFYAPAFDFYAQEDSSPDFDSEVSARLQLAHAYIKTVCIRMVTLAPYQIIPIPIAQLSKEKSTLGKLSRAKLVKQYQDGFFDKHLNRVEALIKLGRAKKFVKPAEGSHEATVCGIFESIFELDAGSISAEDNFFEMGGTSIDVIRLKREIEVALNLPDEIPILRILLHPTPTLLAGLIKQVLDPAAAGTASYDPIVPLQTTGSKTPIFFIHPGVGEVLIFVNLAKYFHNVRPFYALRARGFDKGHPTFKSMEEMVTCYADAIGRVQPVGPYAVAGYSYGGVVAFEVAKVLESRGKEVKFVGLVNIPPHIADRMHEIDYVSGLLNLSYFLSLVSKEQAKTLAPPMRELPTKEDQLNHLWNLAPPERLHELQLTIPKLDHWVGIATSLIECGKNYVPGGSVECLDVFYAIPLAGTKEDWLNNKLKPWTEFCRRDVEGRPNGSTFTDVPGQHYTLMDIDHVPFYQKFLRERLEARGL